MANYICAECHHIGKPKGKKPGSKGMEIFMWSLFPVGIPYTIWRMLKKTKVCAACESSFLVDENSVLGSQILNNMEQNVTGRRVVTPAEFQRFIGQAKKVELEPASPSGEALQPVVARKEPALQPSAKINGANAAFNATKTKPAGHKPVSQENVQW